MITWLFVDEVYRRQNAEEEVKNGGGLNPIPGSVSNCNSSSSGGSGGDGSGRVYAGSGSSSNRSGDWAGGRAAERQRLLVN